MADSESSPEFLTTREVAALLRVRERKVYEMAAADEIPCRRVTGKLLFPRAAIEAWLAGPSEAPAKADAAPSRPNVVAGSHDPLLDWALREAGTGLATFFDGSLDGLRRLSAGEAMACGLHVFEPQNNDWNVGHVSRSEGGRSCVLIEWAKRRQGLILGKKTAGRIAAITDLPGYRVALRQETAGSRMLFDHLIGQSGLESGSLSIAKSTARTETDAADMVASGQADVSLGLETVARQFNLGFVPLMSERYDLLVDRRCYFEPPLQSLFAFSRSPAFSAKAEAMGGYDLAGHGQVHWNSP
jgi:excisionase family DNA binding protein